MVMSQGTYTFLACFAGFWLVWALIVMVCCFCSFLQRKLKRRREDRLREQCLRALELEPLDCSASSYTSRDPLECTGTGYPAREPLEATGMGFSPREALECTGVRYPVREPLECTGVRYPVREPLECAGVRYPVREPLECIGMGYSPREPPQFCLPPPMMSSQVPTAHTISPGTWTPPQAPDLPADGDACGKPPCYEEAVLMEDPPPPYSEVLADPRGGTYTKPDPCTSREHQESETRKMALPERGYSSLIRLPSARRWDSLGHLLATMDLNHNNLPSEPQASAIATMPREGRTHADLGLHALRGLDQGYGLPTAFPLLGRSTAV